MVINASQIPPASMAGLTVVLSAMTIKALIMPVTVSVKPSKGAISPSQLSPFSSSRTCRVPIRDRSFSRYFVQTNPGMGPGPYTFRVTDSYGNLLVDTGLPHVEKGSVNGVGQFPPGP